jgi:hypothetical protein
MPSRSPTPAWPADWVVELRDDSADLVLAEQRGRLAAASAAIPFALQVDPARVAPAHRHSLRGALQLRGQVQWLSAPQPVSLTGPRIDGGSLPLQPYMSPGGFASTLDCGGRRLTLGFVGERLRLSEGTQVQDLQPLPGSRPPRFQNPGDPGTFVQTDDTGATVSLQGQLLPRCTRVVR